MSFSNTLKSFFINLRRKSRSNSLNKNNFTIQLRLLKSELLGNFLILRSLIFARRLISNLTLKNKTGRPIDYAVWLPVFESIPVECFRFLLQNCRVYCTLKGRKMRGNKTSGMQRRNGRSRSRNAQQRRVKWIC